MNKGDHARKFNSVMPSVNETWAADVLKMQRNPHKGPDLIDEKKIVEIKFRLMCEDEYSHLCWRILEHQKGYRQDGKKAYWGFGKYFLSKPVSKIRTNKELELESLVVSRELFIVPWEWVDQFPVYHQSGKTEKSEWNNHLIFAKGRLLPEIIESYQVEKGFVYLTSGVNKGDFNNVNE
jgi:hypothetical protein